jgi:hypothetical protein
MGGVFLIAVIILISLIPVQTINKSEQAVLSSGVCAANAIRSLRIFRIWAQEYRRKERN